MQHNSVPLLYFTACIFKGRSYLSSLYYIERVLPEYTRSSKCACSFENLLIIHQHSLLLTSLFLPHFHVSSYLLIQGMSNNFKRSSSLFKREICVYAAFVSDKNVPLVAFTSSFEAKLLPLHMSYHNHYTAVRPIQFYIPIGLSSLLRHCSSPRHNIVSVYFPRRRAYQLCNT